MRGASHSSSEYRGGAGGWRLAKCSFMYNIMQRPMGHLSSSSYLEVVLEVALEVAGKCVPLEVSTNLVVWAGGASEAPSERTLETRGLPWLETHLVCFFLLANIKSNNAQHPTFNVQRLREFAFAFTFTFTLASAFFPPFSARGRPHSHSLFLLFASSSAPLVFVGGNEGVLGDAAKTDCTRRNGAEMNTTGRREQVVYRRRVGDRLTTYAGDSLRGPRQVSRGRGDV